MLGSLIVAAGSNEQRRLRYTEHRETNAMGKGDIRTRRGKIRRGTYGVRRPKKSKKRAGARERR